MNGASAVGFVGILTIFIFIGLVGLILYAVFSMAIKRSGLREEISGLKQEIRLLKERLEKNEHNFD
ncbi:MULTISPECIES: hypothetical protein [Paenibacillus]|uniref:hypothetical protein n=1 Tax=Paenibacillus TaxID=44249 RepID=UPI0007BF24FB|nr:MULTISPECIES: hypothetical protein [Paenibacillus]MCZ1267553.1 hypothetical protein [Paenibacillus tundrae]WDQ32021.1 hypothetical protein PTQ21_27125 [Paenibacillus marchantiae]